MVAFKGTKILFFQRCSLNTWVVSLFLELLIHQLQDRTGVDVQHVTQKRENKRNMMLYDKGYSVFYHAALMSFWAKISYLIIIITIIILSTFTINIIMSALILSLLLLFICINITLNFIAILSYNHHNSSTAMAAIILSFSLLSSLLLSSFRYSIAQCHHHHHNY